MNESGSRIQQRKDELLSLLQQWNRPGVAFSGGVDSTVVAKAAVLVAGTEAIAFTSVSDSLASGELETAVSLAKEIGIRHEVVTTIEIEDSAYRRNNADRCYFCKTHLYEKLAELADQYDLDVLLNGANQDDLGDYRPGLQAAKEHQIVSPLLEANFTKSDVRELAKYWNLTIWDKPALPCLASRIAYGLEVTPERLRRVDLAEQFLRELLSLTEFRVRHEENFLARIEVPCPALPLLLEEENRILVVQRFRELGFQSITLDLEGFRSGSLNERLELISLETKTSNAPE